MSPEQRLIRRLARMTLRETSQWAAWLKGTRWRVVSISFDGRDNGGRATVELVAVRRKIR